MRGMSKNNSPLSRVFQSILVFIVILWGCSAALAQQLSDEASANFEKQVKILMEEKAALTPVQRKVNSSIIRQLHKRVLRDQIDLLPQLKSDVILTDKNEVLTDIKANVSDSLLELIRANGGTIINQFPHYRAIRALLPITAVEVIAAHPDVQFIDKAVPCTTNKTNTSEGDVAHNAPVVRTKGFAGAGIKVGVLSDSVDYLSQVQASGDLPAVTVLSGQSGVPGTGEGTAMLEIVYDLAPSAPLYFATAYNSPANFATNIINLKNAGCKVIVDDVMYFNESPFQDDIISQAVSTVTSAGVLYFSSAGNSGNVHSGTSGTWEGNFVDNGSGRHVFSTGVTMDLITASPSQGVITLQWSDPLGGSTNDYDLYALDSGGNVLAVSNTVQNGTQDPYEALTWSGGSIAGIYLAINKHAGAANRFLHLETGRSRLQYNTHGVTKGHCTVESAFGVAAVSAAGRTTPFTGSQTLETFTSDGPRRIFYNPNGTAITPGNFLATGGKVRNKPDITAADGVLTATGLYNSAFNPFYGTSAAAPHAAAIAALLLSSHRGGPNQIRNALIKGALPTPPVWNEYAGFGIIMGDRALNLLHSGALPSLLLLP
jgi:hypothetical protein